MAKNKPSEEQADSNWEGGEHGRYGFKYRL